MIPRGMIPRNTCGVVWIFSWPEDYEILVGQWNFDKGLVQINMLCYEQGKLKTTYSKEKIASDRTHSFKQSNENEYIRELVNVII